MIAGLILAAGESLRMGQDKALLAYRGRTFVESVIATLREAGIERVAVVLGHHAEEIQHAVRLDDVEVVINPDYPQGQTSSLQAGLRALASAALEAVVLCLVDHPAISADVVKTLVATFQHSQAPVVIPTLQGKHGHPVLLARPLFQPLLELSPEEGANKLVHQFHDRAAFVEVNDRGILLDVDDPETYMKLSSP